MVESVLYGFLPSDFGGEVAPCTTIGETPAPPYGQEYPPVEIRNARELQADATSEGAFFAEHGFVLLPHATAVRDWDRDIGSVYLAEIETIIRDRLLRGRRIEVQQQASLLRRGRDTNTPFYAEGVHSDGPLTAETYALNVRAFAAGEAEAWWRKSYARDEVAGFMSIDFWRTTNMREPLRHMPLALCEPNSVDRKDILPSTMVGIAPNGATSHHLALRFNVGQQWYYYPEVTESELIAFKLNEFWKDNPGAPPQNVFHSAFRDPRTTDDAKKRQSCEHRVGVMVLRD